MQGLVLDLQVNTNWLQTDSSKINLINNSRFKILF